MKKPHISLAAGILVLFFLGCAGNPGIKTAGPLGQNRDEKRESLWILRDYRNRERDASVPRWVNAYLEGGSAGVEALEEFQDRFVFVAANSGTNFSALSQWQEGFSPELDFPRLAAVRMENRFLRALSSYPDDEYGGYYESLVRAASDFEWHGAVREDDFWILRRFAEIAGEGGDQELPETGAAFREAYDFLVLVCVEKSVLIPQIDHLLSNIKPVPPLSRDQSSSVNRVREHFYEGF